MPTRAFFLWMVSIVAVGWAAVAASPAAAQDVPPIVVVQPAGPPRVVYQGAYGAPRYAGNQGYWAARKPRWTSYDLPLAIRVSLGASLGERVEMGGGTVELRYVLHPHFALDAGIGVYGGTDYYRYDRVEVPLTLNGVVIFNPDDEFRLYGLLGVGMDVSEQSTGLLRGSRTFVHLGGQFGAGVEWRFVPVFSLFFEVRGFVRYNVDRSVVEFTEPSTGRQTNTSGGAIAAIGASLYF